MCHSNCGCGHGGRWGMCNTSLGGKILLIIGGLNWGLVGVGMLLGSADSWNVVHMLLGSVPVLEAVIYVLVGLAAIMKVFGCRCKTCTGGVCTSCMEHDKMHTQA